MNELSPRQKDVLNYILSSFSDRSLIPTYREIGDALGIASTNGVADHIKALIEKGYLRKNGEGIARGVVLTKKAKTVRRQQSVPVPVVAEEAALDPGLSLYEETIFVDRTLIPPNVSIHAFRSQARPAFSIYEGDLVFVALRRPKAGRLAMVEVDGKVALQVASDQVDPEARVGQVVLVMHKFKGYNDY